MNSMPIAKNLPELSHLISHHSGTITGTVTQTIASWLLQRNQENRPLNEKAVARFSEILKSGRWQNTGEPVIVSREGMLNDGQHRLTAILRTNIAAELDVRFGVPRAAFQVTGTGAERTRGQILSIAGITNANKSAAVARVVLMYDRRIMANNGFKPDPDILLELLRGEPHISEVIRICESTRFNPRRSAAIVGILAVAARHASLCDIQKFADISAGAACPSDSNPAHRLYIHIRDAALSRVRIKQVELSALTAISWNSFVNKQEISRIRLDENAMTSQGFPCVQRGDRGGAV
ncbi:hypothetical protein GOB93_03160 [Acetobacter musti]|uniref:ParB/Sulfiredoxin domain-containing protein n=1 Tax=Acetobacter musti TaxID=864732 RepID=A0ABX0JLK8_9PROT|nr:hypothetical protein [Acetobacter musti]NHN83638.1 hypothetical protein [Acetobacter musti]